MKTMSASWMESALLLLALTLVSARLFAADVGVSINVGEPGFYGRIDMGDFPRPEVIYARPVIIERSREVYAPIYLRVPPGYERHWNRHCREYHACGRPVYFVRDKWYREVYAPHYHERHRMDGREERHGEGRGHRGEGYDRD